MLNIKCFSPSFFKGAFVLLILYVFSGTLHAQSLADFEKKTFRQGDNSLNYRILYPKHYEANKKYPLVIFLHGSGERGDDNEAQLIHGGKWLLDSLEALHPCIVIVPQCPKDSYWASVLREESQSNGQTHLKFTFYDAPKPTLAMQLIMSLIEHYLKSGTVNKERVYVGGLSMGGMGTYELIARMPRTFAAAFVICGAADYDWIERKAPHTPLWIFHGDQDQVVSPRYAKEAYDRLNNGKRSIKYTVYPGVNHNSWDNVFVEPGVWNWIFQFRRHKGNILPQVKS